MRSPDHDDARPPSLALSVSGGAGGIEATYDDLVRLGRLYGATGGRLVEAAWDDQREAADGDLLASALLSPGTFADAEAAILDGRTAHGGWWSGPRRSRPRACPSSGSS